MAIVVDLYQKESQGSLATIGGNYPRHILRLASGRRQLFLIHFFGDVPSPRIIGFISDHSNLRLGLGASVIALVASTLIQWWGSHYAPRDSSVQATAH